MMSRWPFLPVLLLGVVCAAAPARSQPAELPEPYLLVRSIQRLHVQMAEGSAAAQAAHSKLVQEVAESFARARPHVWQKPRNAAAAAILLLSGGPSVSIRKLSRDGAFPEESEELILAALAYAEGRQAEATSRLEELDLNAYPVTLEGQLALATASLLARSDPVRADELFSRARLAMPGTLVEETALRRQAFLADERGDVDRFAFFSGQYLRRFPKSVYAPTLHERFPVAALRFAMADVAIDKLDILMKELEPEMRRSIFLDIAREGLTRGRLPVAALSAERARDLSREGSILARRALIYHAAAIVLGPKREEALQSLSGLSLEGLSTQDEELGGAVLGLGSFISAWPPRAAADSLAAEPAPTDLMRRAEEVEASIDALLAEKQG